MGNSLTSEELRDQIDFEIENIRKDREVDGWTIKALMVALASLFWIFLKETETPLTWSIVLPQFIVVTLLYDLLVLSVNTIDDICAPSNANIRFHSSNYFGSNLLHALANTVKLSVIGFLSLKLYHSTGAWQILPAAIFYFALALLLVVIAIIIQFEAMLLTKSRSKNTPTTFVFFIIHASCLAVPISYLWSSVQISSSTPVPHEVRISVLLVVGIQLIILLTQKRKRPSSIDVLQDLRRNLVFSSTDLSETLTQLDILVRGMRGVQVVQNEVNSVIRIITEQDRIIAEVHETYKATREFMSRRPQERENIIAAEAILESCTPLLNSLKASDDTRDIAFRKLQLKSKVVANIDKDSLTNIDALYRDIGEALKRHQDRCTETQEEKKKINELIKSTQ